MSNFQDLIDALRALDKDVDITNTNRSGRIWLTDTDVFSQLDGALKEKVNKVLELADELLVKDNGRANHVAWVNVVRLGRIQGYLFDIRSGEEDSAGIYTPICNIAFDCY